MEKTKSVFYSCDDTENNPEREITVSPADGSLYFTIKGDDCYFSWILMDIETSEAFAKQILHHAQRIKDAK